ncbi:arginine/serine-rich coiled-coil protein 2 isoform X2 [Eurosta solidaginis]
MRNQSSGGGRRDTPTARNTNYREESSQRQISNSYGNNNRSETSTHHSRDRDSQNNHDSRDNRDSRDRDSRNNRNGRDNRESRDNRDSTRDRRDNRRESRENARGDSRDDKDRNRERDKRYSDYKNDRTRSRDNKTDDNRDRDNNNDNKRRPPPRDDERARRSSSPSSYKSKRYCGNGRSERPRYDSSSSNATTSSTFRPPNHHNRAYDQRHSDRDRNERRSSSRNRICSISPSPSPPPQPHPRHSYSHKRSYTRTDKSYRQHRTRSRSRSRTPKRRSVSRERSDRESYALEQARKSALEMERKIQTDDQHGTQNESQTYASGSSFRSHTQPLLALPLSETAPKQPNVIAVTPASSSSAEPAVIQLPSYYNPNVINPNKYAEQVQKRKLIWGAKKTEDTAKKWGNAQFSQDTDGKVASKFMRLMGIKGNVPPPKEDTAVVEQKAVPSVAPDVKTREVMFTNLQQQYEVARQVTHTMRGVGLGFSSQARPF